MKAEKGRHHRERTADEHRVTVLLSCAGDRQRDGAQRGNARPEGDADEVRPPTDEDLVVPHEMEERGRNDRGNGRQRQHGDPTIAHRAAYRHESVHV